MQKTKMIFTIGPSSFSEEILKEFILLGMSAARLNFSHGNYESHLKTINTIKKLRKELNSPTAILLDIKGPKIRTHNFKDDSAILQKGQKFSFRCDKEILGDNTGCSISYTELYKDVFPGGTILVDDGLLEFTIDSVENKIIHCTVVNGGIIKNHKGVNVPYVKIGLPPLTEKDKEDLIFGCAQEVDYVAASFIRKGSDMEEVRAILDSNGGRDIKTIAKIETQEGVDNIDEILSVADGIMVARGDMGVEIPIEKVPLIQKSIIKKCNQAGKIVITATQMLDSMIKNSRPTRAEATDICNAVFDGTDAVMLSGESASGDYPLEAASTMARIAQETENHLDYEVFLNRLKDLHLMSFADAISYSTVQTSNKLTVKAIVAATQSGSTAKLISKYKPSCPIIAITPSEKVLRTLNLHFGIFPVLTPDFSNVEEVIPLAKSIAIENDIAVEGDSIIIAAGMPTAMVGGTNMFKLEKI
ncbi:pyruvate kinase [Alloiococcus sp. CFN-8]|uniref:pyruvate kinase n=1 Tax=Alloiococcus sp. CFN-8 TaxID=3416081 RepID=UPI003CEAAD1A